jgi:endonuclease III
LKRRYGRLPAPPSDPFTLFVWGIVSNHSTPRKRDATLTALRRHQALTPDGMWKASQKHLEESVALAGPYPSQRILGLRKGVEIFRRHPDFLAAIRGPVPAALKALKGMPQMGESGSYRMLLFAGNHPVLPVDARVGRVATRLGYGEKSANFPKSARSIRQAVASELPASVDAYRAAYLYLEHHGAATCTETSPRCDECPLLNDCSHGQRELSAPKAR